MSNSKASVPRNFECPMTGIPCVDPRCGCDRCVPQKIQELHQRQAEDEAARKAYWAKELRDLISDC